MEQTNLTSRSRNFIVSGLFLLSTVFLAACGDGRDGRNIEIPGIDGPLVTLHNEHVLISIVFEELKVDGGLRYTIPRLGNSYIEVSPDFNSNGTLMAVYVAIDDILGDNFGRLDPQALPGGRPLPGVASGTLPAIAFSIEKFRNMGFYIGRNVFGVFIPFNNLGDAIGQSIITARFFSSGDRIGNISIVGHDSYGENAGILLMLNMDNQVQRQLKRYTRRL